MTESPGLLDTGPLIMRRYRNRPMSVADACLVRLSEIHASARIFTLDSDFRIYRRHGKSHPGTHARVTVAAVARRRGWHEET